MVSRKGVPIQGYYDCPFIWNYLSYAGWSEFSQVLASYGVSYSGLESFYMCSQLMGQTGHHYDHNNFFRTGCVLSILSVLQENGVISKCLSLHVSV